MGSFIRLDWNTSCRNGLYVSAAPRFFFGRLGEVVQVVLSSSGSKYTHKRAWIVVSIKIIECSEFPAEFDLAVEMLLISFNEHIFLIEQNFVMEVAGLPSNILEAHELWYDMGSDSLGVATRFPDCKAPQETLQFDHRP